MLIITLGITLTLTVNLNFTLKLYFHSNSDSDPKPNYDVQTDPNDEHGPDTYAELAPNTNINHNPKYLTDKEFDPDLNSTANPNLVHWWPFS